MMKPIGYDEAKTYTGDFQTLPPGGYVCIIKNVRMIATKSGREAMELLVDIAQGEYQGYFQRQFDNSASTNKKWPNGGRITQLVDGNSLPYFKGMITNIEKSNGGFDFERDFNFDETRLKGRSIGCIFGREQYRKSNGELAFATKVFRTASTGRIEQGVEAPEDRLLKQSITEGLGEEIIFDTNEIPF